MLFRKKSPEEKMEKLVHRKDWSRLADYVYGDENQKKELAQALAHEDDVLKEVCETLKKVGNDHVTADLHEVLMKLPKEKEDLREELSSTIQLLHKKL